MNRVIGWTALAIAVPAAAAVKSSAPAGFETGNTAVIAAPPAEVYAMLVTPSRWWNGQHSYSGDAANMTLEARAGGCFCERIPADGATVEHARVVYAQPGKTLRLQGGLGPLQAEGVSATLTWSLKPVAAGTEVTQTYVVGGYVRGGTEALAPIVDRVLAEQLTRLQAVFSRR